MHMCGRCMSWCGILLLGLGVLFLLQDLKIWNFWGVSWYTVVFLLMGACHLGSCCCKECKTKKK